MRADLKVLWIEDSEEFYNSNQERLQLEFTNLNIKVDFTYCQDAKQLKDELRVDIDKFVNYDLFFIDYALSYGIRGNTIIESLRKMIETDILFYSSDRIDELNDAVSKKQNIFMGIYTAEKKDFIKVALRLIKKNARKLLSLTSIRGSIMDNTSENDFIVNSFMLRRYECLDEECKKRIKDLIRQNYLTFESNAKRKCNVIDSFLKGEKGIKELLTVPSYFFPIKTKYQCVIMMLENEGSVDCAKLKDYKKLIDARNKLAHRKLELSEDETMIYSFSDLDEYEKDDRNGIDSFSKDDWDQIRKQTVEIGNIFDSILRRIQADDNREME